MEIVRGHTSPSTQYILFRVFIRDTSVLKTKLCVYSLFMYMTEKLVSRGIEENPFTFRLYISVA